MSEKYAHKNRKNQRYDEIDDHSFSFVSAFSNADLFAVVLLDFVAEFTLAGNLPYQLTMLQAPKSFQK